MVGECYAQGVDKDELSLNRPGINQLEIAAIRVRPTAGTPHSLSACHDIAPCQASPVVAALANRVRLSDKGGPPHEACRRSVRGSARGSRARLKASLGGSGAQGHRLRA
jgi:hypothetical protein